MIFQDPLTSLNPLYRIGDQLVETIRTHLNLSESAARSRAIDLLAEVGIPAPENASMPIRTSFPAACASASSSRSRFARNRN